MQGRRWTTAVLIVAAAGIVIAGCGGGGGKKATATGASSSSGNGATVNLVAKDFMFEPATMTATAGKPVTVTIKNEGQAEHNFSIESLKVNKDVEKGESQTVTFTPTQSGTVQFFCEYHKNSHGMMGSLNVT
jgi:nitrosocyanin